MTMRVRVFSTKPYDRRFLDAANDAVRAGHAAHEFGYVESRLSAQTVALAEGADAVCIFVNDEADSAVIAALAAAGVKLLALRCAGFNNVDLAAAREHGIAVARVPAYSPHAVAEHTLALILALNRGIHRAYNRVREGNFALEGLLGFDLAGRTVGVVGTGRIGEIVVRILLGFGCRVLACDPYPNPAVQALGVPYASFDQVLAESDVITLHCPLTPATHHLMDGAALARIRPGAMLVNTSRGAIVDTRAVIAALKAGRLGSLGIDVYEEEADLFFEDLSSRFIDDDVFARLLTFPNVLVTGHQGFFTEDALRNIAETTIGNLDRFVADGVPLHPVSVERIA
jgi:D-lactate dehydrogenase